MKINRANRISIFILATISICSGFFNAFGCAYIDGMTPVVIDNKSHHYNAEAITLERGNQAFQNNDYKKALEIYRMLSQLARNDDIRRKSLYGLACTRLVLAESPEELSASIILWDVWSQLESAETKDEYPILLRPLLLQKGLPEKIKAEPKKNEKEPGANKKLKKIIVAKDKEILLQKNRINKMDKEIKKLKHQLSSLEAIDKNIKQKMTEIE
ncbi:MAG: hypothetical protein JRI91_01990 [Deltaproteobacteria bacterium]|nr:hypothetical protein [Deltaproteobacteria bacterium]